MLVFPLAAPQARIANPVAHMLITSPDLYPLPNNAGTEPLGFTNNYMSASRDHSRITRLIRSSIGTRPDKDTLSGRWSLSCYEGFGAEAALPLLLPKGTYGGSVRQARRDPDREPGDALGWSQPDSG